MKWLRDFWKFVNPNAKPSVSKPVDQKPKPSAIKGKKPVRIGLGLDLGTHFTKMAYCNLDGESVIKPLVFEHCIDNLEAYLVPSVACLDDGHNLLFGYEAFEHIALKEWDYGLRRIKMIVAGQYSKEFCDPDLKNTYMRYIRDHCPDGPILPPGHLLALMIAHFIHLANVELAKVFKQYELSYVHICMPIDYLEDEKVKSAFEKIVHTAQRYVDAPPLSKKYEYYTSMESKPLESSKNKVIYFVPESAAQTASYLSSNNIEKMLHVLVDFGSGTTDVSIFEVMDLVQGRPEVNWYSSLNIPMGMHSVEKILSRNRATSNADMLQRFCNGAKFTDVEHEEIRKILECIWKKTIPCWCEAYKHIMTTSIYDNVTIFVSGGGCGHSAVKEIFEKNYLGKIYGPHPVKPIPKPDRLDASFWDVSFERMSLAYGLALPPDYLIDFKLPTEAPYYFVPKGHIVETDDGRTPTGDWHHGKRRYI